MLVAFVVPQARRAVVSCSSSGRAVPVVNGVVVVSVIVKLQFFVAEHDVDVGDQGSRTVRKVRPRCAYRGTYD